jgi:hypothetical protein
MNSNTLAYAIGLAGTLLIVFLWGRSNGRRTARKWQRETCQQLHDVALNQREQFPLEAALTAAEAAGHANRHECFNLVAGVLDDMGHTDAAADYWARARSAARQQARDEQASYYYREAKSFLRGRNYEFAYLRSKAAIELIELGEMPGNVDNRDFHQHLRAVRMISSLHHLRGSEAWKAAMVDAVWLQSQASEATLAKLGASIGAAHLAGEVTADMVASVDQV